MPATINTRPQAIDLTYYPGQTITLSLIFPNTYLDTRVFKAFLGGRTTPGVELTCTEEVDTLTLTIVADSSDTQAFDWPAEFTLVPFVAPSTYGSPIFVGTWTPGTDGQVAPTVATFTVRTPDEIQVTVVQSSPPGEIGPVGPEGPAGTSVTIIGTLPDVGDLPVSGNTVGDGYIIDGDLWVWTVDLEWVNVGQIQGPPGEDGMDGTNGADGKTILYGTAAPTTEGVNGDFYIRTTTNFIYGPKAAGVWPAGTSLVGPTGAAGANGTDGTDGTDGIMSSVVAGEGISVDSTDPANPIISTNGQGWVLVVDEPGDSITNWSSIGGGTWSADAGGFIKQTSTTAAYRGLLYDNLVFPGASIAVEAQVRFPISAVTGRRAMLAPTSTGGVSSVLDPWLGLQENTDAAFYQQGDNLTASTSMVVDEDVWYTVRTVTQGQVSSVIVDGTFKRALRVTYGATLVGADSLMLITYQGECHFRNIKVWVLASPFEISPVPPAGPSYTNESDVVMSEGPPYDTSGGVTRIGDDLLAVYRSGTNHVSGGIAEQRTSTDDGATWSSPTTIRDNSMDIRDTEVTTLANGDLICSFTERSEPEVSDWLPYIMRSTDDGATWGTAVQITNGFSEFSIIAAKVIELPSGDLLAPVYGSDSASPGATDWGSELCISTDDGATWSVLSTIAAAGVDSRRWEEPNVTRGTDGTLYCALRSDNSAAGIYLTISTDDGATWGTRSRIFDGSGRPTIFFTADGALAIQYRHTDIDSGRAAARFSFNDGATWTDPYFFASVLPFQYGSWVDLVTGDLGAMWSVEQNTTIAHIQFDTFSYDAG